MADSSNIDAAIIATLVNDTTLRGYLPDGVYFDEAPPNATKFVIVSLVDAVDEAVWKDAAPFRAIEDALYLVKAVMLGKGGGDIGAAAARIDALLDDASLSITGYTLMAIARESRVRYTEVDDVDPTIRWQHRGGHYRIQVSL